MSTADLDFKASKFTARAATAPVIGRTVLSLLVAAVEGLAAGLVVLGAVAGYHLVIRRIPSEGVDWSLYLAFAGGAALLYACFSAIATSRLLDVADRKRSGLTAAFTGWSAATGIALLAAFLLGASGDLSRMSLSAAYVVGIPLMLALRGIGQSIIQRRISQGALHYQRIALIGARGDVLGFMLNGDLWRHGHHVTGTCHLEDAMQGGTMDMRAIAAFVQDCVRRGVETMVIVAPLKDFDTIETLISEMKRYALNIVYAPATTSRTLKFLDVVPIGANNALRFIRKPLGDGSVFGKRVADIVLSAIGLVVLSPLFAAVALAIRLDSPGPVIYRQARRGFNGESFMIWKFRSMRVTEPGQAMRQAQRGDDRITRIGRFIRATSIDELPQLVNVLLGQMSIVGPRPHALSHDDELARVMATYAHRQRIKPGITGWAQVNGFRGETATFEAIEGRTLHDLHYIDNWSLLLDFWIIVLTVFSVRTHKNVF